MKTMNGLIYILHSYAVLVLTVAFFLTETTTAAVIRENDIPMEVCKSDEEAFQKVINIAAEENRQIEKEERKNQDPLNSFVFPLTMVRGITSNENTTNTKQEHIGGKETLERKSSEVSVEHNREESTKKDLSADCNLYGCEASGCDNYNCLSQNQFANKLICDLLKQRKCDTEDGSFHVSDDLKNSKDATQQRDEMEKESLHEFTKSNSTTSVNLSGVSSIKSTDEHEEKIQPTESDKSGDGAEDFSIPLNDQIKAIEEVLEEACDSRTSSRNTDKESNASIENKQQNASLSADTVIDKEKEIIFSIINENPEIIGDLKQLSETNEPELADTGIQEHLGHEDKFRDKVDERNTCFVNKFVPNPIPIIHQNMNEIEDNMLNVLLPTTMRTSGNEIVRETDALGPQHLATTVSIKSPMKETTVDQMESQDYNEVEMEKESLQSNNPITFTHHNGNENSNMEDSSNRFSLAEEGNIQGSLTGLKESADENAFNEVQNLENELKEGENEYEEIEPKRLCNKQNLIRQTRDVSYNEVPNETDEFNCKDGLGSLLLTKDSSLRADKQTNPNTFIKVEDQSVIPNEFLDKLSKINYSIKLGEHDIKNKQINDQTRNSVEDKMINKIVPTLKRVMDTIREDISENEKQRFEENKECLLKQISDNLKDIIKDADEKVDVENVQTLEGMQSIDPEEMESSGDTLCEIHFPHIVSVESRGDDEKQRNVRSVIKEVAELIKDTEPTKVISTQKEIEFKELLFYFLNQLAQQDQEEYSDNLEEQPSKDEYPNKMLNDFVAGSQNQWNSDDLTDRNCNNLVKKFEQKLSSCIKQHEFNKVSNYERKLAEWLLLIGNILRNCHDMRSVSNPKHIDVTSTSHSVYPSDTHSNIEYTLI